MPKELELTRRRILGGLGTIGVAGAAAGLGTSAYLSDEESFDNNVITAGTLDLKVGWQQIYYGPTAGNAIRPRDSQDGEFINAHPDHNDDGQQSITVESGTYNWNDGGAEGDGEGVTDHLNCNTIPVVPEENPYGEGQESLVELTDVKPGDGGQISFNLCLCDNPGYIWLTFSNFSEDGGVTTEPEQDAMDDGESDDGELAENMTVYVSLDEDCNSRFNDEDTVVWQNTLARARNLVEEGSNGLLLKEECFDAGCHCVNVGWDIPTDVGNEIQGDSVSFDLGFYTEQCRHNPEPTFPENNTPNGTTTNGTPTNES